MYITRKSKRVGDKEYQSVLLVKSVRKDGMPRHETLLNLTQWDTGDIEALEEALKRKAKGAVKKSTGENWALEEVESTTGKSIGGLLSIQHLAKKAGILKALGTTEEAKLAMVLIAGRLLTQGSRLKLCEWQEMNEVEAVIGAPKYTEDDLYKTLDWLSKNQAKIEQRLFEHRHGVSGKKPALFLYDITSSYFEGKKNELAAFGHNRDGKKGKEQIVIGLLTDEEGVPVSVEVFEGNRSDCTTVIEQVEKMAHRFGVTELVMVGDKGMIKRTQIEAFTDGIHYITSITREQIQTLIKKDVIQLSLFDNELAEVEDNGVRYVFRKNPIRTQEVRSERQARLDYLKEQIQEMNTYLSEHPKARVNIQVAKCEQKLKRFKLQSFCHIHATDRLLSLNVNEEERSELSKLDGCYVLKTDLSKEDFPTQTIHERYKDLAKVESAFRTIKTGWLEIRPIYVRKESRTRAHVFVTMLAYMIAQSFSQLIKPLKLTVEAAWGYVTQLQTTLLSVANFSVKKIQSPSPKCAAIFDALNLKIPNLSFPPVVKKKSF